MRLTVTLTLCVLALVIISGQARADVLQYEHDGSALFSLAFPEGWFIEPNDESEDGIRILQAMPGDESKLWFGIWVAPKTSTLERGLEYIASLDGQLFTDVEASEPKSLEMNGMQARTLYGTAKRQGEDVEFAVALIEPRAGAIVVALYVGRPQTWEKHRNELEALVASIKPV